MKRIALSAGALLLALAVGYGFGRYATPARIEVRELSSTVTKWQTHETERVVQGPVRTVTHTVERAVPCVPGETTPSVETTTTVEAGPVIIDRVEDAGGTTTTKTEIRTVTIRSQPRFMLQAGTDPRLVWDAGASYRLLGPVWLGAGYRNDLDLNPLDRLSLRVSLTF